MEFVLFFDFHVQEQSISMQLICILSTVSINTVSIETLRQNLCDRYVFTKNRSDLSSLATASFSFLGK
jgi:hypothetical protein